jgi:WD40 repeat protein
MNCLQNSKDELYYPSCYAVTYIKYSNDELETPKLVSLYSDHSLVVWDIENIESPSQIAQVLSHRACVWDAQFLINGSMLDENNAPDSSAAFVTCSADNALQFWDLNTYTLVNRINMKSNDSNGSNGMILLSIGDASNVFLSLSCQLPTFDLNTE